MARFFYLYHPLLFKKFSMHFLSQKAFVKIQTLKLCIGSTVFSKSKSVIKIWWNPDIQSIVQQYLAFPK